MSYRPPGLYSLELSLIHGIRKSRIYFTFSLPPLPRTTLVATFKPTKMHTIKSFLFLALSGALYVTMHHRWSLATMQCVMGVIFHFRMSSPQKVQDSIILMGQPLGWIDGGLCVLLKMFLLIHMDTNTNTNRDFRTTVQGCGQGENVLDILINRPETVIVVIFSLT